MQKSLNDEHVSAAWKLTDFDEGTTNGAVNNAAAEARRLQNLLSYNLLENRRQDPEMDELTLSAQCQFAVPMAAISVVDLGCQWFKSTQGMNGIRGTSRKVAFCAHTVQRKPGCGVLIVPDASQDPRFRENPLVTGPWHVRFYAGAPIRSPEGEVLGVFCILDTQPRPEGLTQTQQSALKALADCAMANILMA